MKIRWGRLAWVIFACLYLGVFFWNFFHNFSLRFIPTAYLYILILWLSFEFYFRQPFFQSGRLITEDPKTKEKYDYLHFLPRYLFALYFYSCLAWGIADFVWLRKGQIMFLGPFLNIVGIIILILSVLIRLQSDRLMFNRRHKIIKDWLYGSVRHPAYSAAALLTISISFAFSSYFTLIYSLVIGLPLIYFEARLEDVFLAKKNGQDYQTYIKDTSLFIPAIL